MRWGYNKVLIKDALALLENTHWSTVMCEQIHGSMALVHRQHPTYEEESLCTRATLHSLRRVIGIEPPRGPSSVHSLEAKLHRLQCSQPSKSTGRHLYLADRYAAAKSLLRICRVWRKC